jgi:hypothetical protein
MNSPSRSLSWRSLVVGLTLAGLGACSSTFRFTVGSSNPQQVDSVVVLFGSEAEFEGKTGTKEIATVIQPSKVGSYYGYAEFDVVLDGATAADGPGAELRWVERSSRLEALRAEVEISTTEPGQLRFRMPRSMFDVHKDLAIAVVVRTADRQYRLKRWQRSALTEADGMLVIDVTAREISGSY